MLISCLVTYLSVILYAVFFKCLYDVFIHVEFGFGHIVHVLCAMCYVLIHMYMLLRRVNLGTVLLYE